MKRITRNRYLTPAEAEADQAIRTLVKKDFPTAVHVRDEDAAPYGNAPAVKPDKLAELKAAALEMLSALDSMRVSNDWLPGDKARRLQVARQRLGELAREGGDS